MRSALGATRRERVLSEGPARQVVLVDDPGRGPRVVRRLKTPDQGEGPDLVDRASALGLVRGERYPGFATIQDRAIVGRVLEIAEDYVEGIGLGEHIELVRELISVGVAIALVHDVARGLQRLHAVRETYGLPARLVHGRIDVDQAVLGEGGTITLVGFEGARGDQRRDVDQLLRMLLSLLTHRANSRQGSALLAKLSQLRFDSAEQLVGALDAYLGRQDPAELEEKRRSFAAEVARRVGWAPSRAATPLVPESPTDLNSKKEESSPPPADWAHQIQQDLEDGEGPTVADVERPLPEPDLEITVQADDDARQGLLGPAAPPEAPPAEDKSITVGNYRVVASIGRGGMGEIYLARPSFVLPHRKLVALKVLGPEDSGDDEALGMFIDEAAIMAQIDHPNVLKVVDFGQAKGRHYLAMEYLEGRPLVRVMIDAYAKSGGMDYAVIAAICADAARGLHAAHTAATARGEPLRIVHRDVSPQNIFVTYPGVTKVIDFGVARATQRVSKTEVGVVKGKAAYMSPEQTEGREVDARSDVFSLGICLWEMTAGRRLFKRDSEYDTLMAVSTGVVEKPTVVRGKPSSVLDKIIVSALTRNRDKRTQTALELAEELTDYALAQGVKDGHAAVRGLMDQLFGEAAAEERALIQRLEAHAASREEAESLKRLSGVSPRKGGLEITIVGAAASLAELDGFGSLRPPEAGYERGKTSAMVLRAVEAVKAIKTGEARPLGQSEPPSSAFEDPSESSLSAIQIEDGDYEVLASRIGPSPWSSPPGPSGASLPNPEDWAPSSLGDTVQMDSEGGLVESGPTRLTRTAEVGLAPEEPSRTAKSPALPEARRRLWLWIAAGVALFALGVGGAQLARRSAVIPEPVPDPVQAVLPQGAEDRAPPAEPAPAEEVLPVEAPTEAVPQPDPSARERPTSTVAAVVADRTATPRPVRASTVSADVMIAELRALGYAVTRSQNRVIVADEAGGMAVIDRASTILRVRQGADSAYLISTGVRSLAHVSWIGRDQAGTRVARALSVNDCGAVARVEGEGVVIQYGARSVTLPLGGGELRDVALEPLPFAERLELYPLGLSFGRRDERSTALHCGIGWWGKQVVVRSLPVGSYRLRWIGGGQEQEQELEIGVSGVSGGRLVGTSSRAAGRGP